MPTRNADESAFTRSGFVADASTVGNDDAARTFTDPADGLTKREYFAIRIMAARIGRPSQSLNFPWDEYITTEAKIAIRATDALLEELSK